MADEKVPEYDRRNRKEKGLITHIVETFNGKQGRKVAFGIWWFWVSTGLLIKGLITNEQWFYCSIFCALLIGFGTIVDSIVAKMGDAVVAIFADKVSRLKSVVSITETKEVTAGVASDASKS